MDSLPTMLGPETLGWAAALLTLLTFISADMRRLRLLALAANAAFIAYGSMAHVLPVMVLHLALVPVNLWRLNQAFRGGPRIAAALPPSRPLTPMPQPARVARRPASWTAAQREVRYSRRVASQAATPSCAASTAPAR